MKHINRCLTALVALALLLLAAACGQANYDPQSVAQVLLDAMQNSDYSTISAHTSPVATNPDGYVLKAVKPNTPLSDPHVADIRKVSDTASDVTVTYTVGSEPTTIVWHMTKHDGGWRVPMEQVLPAVGFVDERHDAGRYRLNGTVSDFTDTMWLVTPGIYTVTTDNGWNGAEWSEPIRITDPKAGTVQATTVDQKDHSDDFTLIELYKKNDKLRDIVTNALVNNSACSAIANAIGAQQKLAPYPEQDGIPKLTDACSPTFAAFTELDVIGKENTHPDSDGWFDFTVNATGGGRVAESWNVFQDDWDSWPKAINWFNGLPQGAQQNTGCLLTGEDQPNYTVCATFEQHDVKVTGLKVKVRYTDNAVRVTDWGDTVHRLYPHIPTLQEGTSQ